MLLQDRKRKHSSPEADPTGSPIGKREKNTTKRGCHSVSYSSLQNTSDVRTSRGQYSPSDEIDANFEMKDMFASHNQKPLFSSPHKQQHHQKHWLKSPVALTDISNSRRASFQLNPSEDFASFRPTSNNNSKDDCESLRNNYTLLEKSPSVFYKNHPTEELFSSFGRLKNKEKLETRRISNNSSPIKHLDSSADHVVKIDEAFLTSEVDMDTHLLHEKYTSESNVAKGPTTKPFRAEARAMETNSLGIPFECKEGIVDEHSKSSQSSLHAKFESSQDSSLSSRKAQTRSTLSSREVEIHQQHLVLIDAKIKSQDSIFESLEGRGLSKSHHEDGMPEDEQPARFKITTKEDRRYEGHSNNSSQSHLASDNAQEQDSTRASWLGRSSIGAHSSESSLLRSAPHDPDTSPASNTTLAVSRESSRAARNKYRGTMKRIRGKNSAQASRALAQSGVSMRSADGSFASRLVEPTAKAEKKKKSCLRSRRGCWTCRIRHKGCPEEKPACSTCVRLGLTCDYSDERPLYMVDTILESRKLKEIREATSKTKKGHRADREDLGGYQSR